MRDKTTQLRARALRRNATETEQLLWNRLRRRQLNGRRFRRQVSMGDYILDFACLEKRLVVEVDGGQHQQKRCNDSQRTRRLEESGFQVLRFWDNDVLKDTAAVLQEILDTLEKRK